MIQKAFEHRTGRVIALSRVVLAIAFIVAVWLDQEQPSRAGQAGSALLAAYLGFAVALLPIAWRNWWLEHRLSRPSFFVDVVAFLAAVYITEDADSDFASPFIAFFAFLLLASTLRWGWRQTAVIALAVSAAYLAVGMALQPTVEHDMLRYGRRLIYMVILALFIVWFGLQRRNYQPDRLQDAVELERRRLFGRILDYGMEQMRARGAAIVWTPGEEPWSELYAAGALGEICERLGPQEPLVQEATPDRPILFDLPRSRGLRLAGADRVMTHKGRLPRELAGRLEVATGLLLPLVATTGKGAILLTAIDGMCTDDLELGEAVAREIGAALDRHRMSTMMHESAVAGVRQSVARDLHDSVAQSLAGACFRLQTLRSTVRESRNAERELAEIHEALRGEQHHVRRMIDRLRSSAESDLSSDLSSDLLQTLDDAARHWGIGAHLTPPRESVRVATRLLHEIQQLLREAVANAVRHGSASKVEVAVAPAGGNLLRLTIVDDGHGFAPGGDLPQPRSIAERVAALGGSLAVESRRGKTLLDIRLPVPLPT